jgi:hypothetical protein
LLLPLKEIYGVSVSHFWHIGIFYPLVDDFRVGSAIVIGNIWRGSRREYKEFKM